MSLFPLSQNIFAHTDINIEILCPDPPSKPGSPEITDYDNESCDIKWAPSANDGGSAITHYIIQTKTNNGDWVQESTLQTPTGDEKLVMKVTGLTENDKIQFRSIAVNAAGESEPSDPSPVPPHVVKHRNMKPRIDRTNLDMKKCKVGETLLIDVDVTGEPTPTTAWSVLGNELTTKDNIVIEHKEYNTKLTIKEGTRKNTEKFKVSAINENGSDEAFVEVVFLGKPSSPLGPLEVYGVTKNSCKLNWRPPADDGGLPIKKYIVEKMDKATGKWEPLCETPGDVTNCPAKGLEEGHEYLFRVKAVNEEGESEPLVADKAIKAKDPFG